MKLIRDYCYKIEAFTKKDLNLLVINHYLWMGSVHLIHRLERATATYTIFRLSQTLTKYFIITFLF
jgi:hypothetical protein